MGSEGTWDGGIYCLVVHLTEELEIKVGALGHRRFPAGYYVYTGSAQRSLKARIERHCRKGKRLRWHIDYLTERAKVIEIKAFALGKEAECRAGREVGSLGGGRLWVEGFGASDCGCEGHLYYFRGRPKLPELLDSMEATDIIRRGGDAWRKTASRGPRMRGRGSTGSSTARSRRKRSS